MCIDCFKTLLEIHLNTGIAGLFGSAPLPRPSIHIVFYSFALFYNPTSSSQRFQFFPFLCILVKTWHESNQFVFEQMPHKCGLSPGSGRFNISISRKFCLFIFFIIYLFLILGTVAYLFWVFGSMFSHDC